MAAYILMVGNSASLTAADTAIKSLIEGRGHTTTLRSDEEAENVGVHEFVVILPSCVTAQLDYKYFDAVVPVLLAKIGATWNNFTGGTVDVSEAATDSIIIVNAASPLAGGLGAGSQVISTGSVVMPFYASPFIADVVEVGETVHSGYDNELTIASIAAGDDGTFGTVPALRILLGFTETHNAALNANGIAIWNGAIEMIEDEIGGAVADATLMAQACL